MKFNYPQLFKHIKNMPEEEWNTDGLNVDWRIEIDVIDQIIRLIFEESDGLSDWKWNLHYFDIRYKKVYSKQESCLRAHSGFAKMYCSVKDKIMEQLFDAWKCHPVFDIVITGWSQGGALAQLAAEDFYFRSASVTTDGRRLKAKVITFGSPKVFSGKESIQYVRSCCQDVVEVAQINDIVTYCPPFPRFEHLDPNFKRVGDKFNLKKFFNPWKYHTSYDDESLYDDLNMCA